MEAARGPRAREGEQHGETGPGPGLHQRKRGAGGASGAKNFFVAVGDGAPEMNDVFSLSTENRALPSELPCVATKELTTRRKPHSPRCSARNRER